MPEDNKQENGRLAQFLDDVVTAAKAGIENVVKPALNNTLFDAVTYILGTVLHIDAAKYTSIIKNKANGVPYEQMFKAGTASNVLDFATPTDPYAVKRIIFATVPEAVSVRESLAKTCEERGKASVSLYYALCKKSDIATYTDTSFGWISPTDIRQSSIKSTAEGYYIELPRIRPIVSV